MGPFSGGGTLILPLLVLGATLAVQLHARGLGLSSISQQAMTLTDPAPALPAAPAASPASAPDLSPPPVAPAAPAIPISAAGSAAALPFALRNKAGGRRHRKQQQQQPQHSNITAIIGLQLLETAASAAAAHPLPQLPLLPTSGTTDPVVLAAIPRLLAPERCTIRPNVEDSSSSSSRVLLQMVGRPTAFTAGKAARLTAALARQRRQAQTAAAAAAAAAAGAGGANISMQGAGVAVAAAAPTEYSVVLETHNTYRTQHHAPELQWDGLLAAAAATYAGQCVFDHDPAATSGESLYVAAGTTLELSEYLRNAVKAWYDQVQLYDWSDPRYSGDTGLFTQLVWKSTTSLGCAAQLCPAGISNTPFASGALVICRYSPPGNVLGRFEANVLPIQLLDEAPPAPAPATVPPSAGILNSGYNFVSPGCLMSDGDEVFKMCMQHDGNVVLFHEQQAIWASNTAGRSAFRPFKLTMQKDGNLVASDNLRKSVWTSSTAGQGAAPYRLVVQEDGNAVILDADSAALWATNTARL